MSNIVQNSAKYRANLQVVLLGLCAVMCPEIEIAGTLEERRVMGVEPE